MRIVKLDDTIFDQIRLATLETMGIAFVIFIVEIMVIFGNVDSTSKEQLMHKLIFSISLACIIRLALIAIVFFQQKRQASLKAVQS